MPDSAAPRLAECSEPWQRTATPDCVMNHCAKIASRRVCSEFDYIVFGHTTGVVGGGYTLEEAQRVWQTELAKCRERGKESDALLFQWNLGHWILCGSLYDVQGARGLVQRTL